MSLCVFRAEWKNAGIYLRVLLRRNFRSIVHMYRQLVLPMTVATARCMGYCVPIMALKYRGGLLTINFTDY